MKKKIPTGKLRWDSLTGWLSFPPLSVEEHLEKNDPVRFEFYSSNNNRHSNKKIKL